MTIGGVLENLRKIREHVTVLGERIERATGKRWKVVRVRQTPPPRRRQRQT